MFVFLKRGGTLEGTVLFSKYKPSPILSCGLGIILKARFEIVDEKRQYLVRLNEQGVEWVDKNNYGEVNLGKEITDDGLTIDGFNIIFVF